MGCGEKKATHPITQVQLRLRNGPTVFPLPEKILVRTACGSGRFRFVKWRDREVSVQPSATADGSDFALNEDSSNWRCRR